MTAFQVITPLVVTSAMLTSSNVPEPATGDSPDPAAWAIGTTYASGARVHVAGTVNKIYESLQAANVGKDPTDAANILWWVEVGSVNRWRMFDASNTSQTTIAGGIDVSLAPGSVYNGVALLNLSGVHDIRVRMTDTVDGVVYDHSESMQAPPLTADWYAYFFDAITSRNSLVLLDLPTYGSAVLRIQMNSAVGVVAGCGVAVVGRRRSFGHGIQLGARVGIQDYSRKERNAFGDYQVTQRAFNKRADFTMWLDGSEVDAVQDLLASLRATPCVWVGSSKYTSALIYGFYKDFEITIAYSDLSSCTLTLEGLT